MTQFWAETKVKKLITETAYLNYWCKNSNFPISSSKFSKWCTLVFYAVSYIILYISKGVLFNNHLGSTKFEVFFLLQNSLFVTILVTSSDWQACYVFLVFHGAYKVVVCWELKCYNDDKVIYNWVLKIGLFLLCFLW